MKTASKILLALIILGVVIWNVGQFMAYRDTSFDISLKGADVDYALLFPTSITLDLELEVRNPSTSYALYIPEIDGEIYLEESFIDDFHISGKRIPPGGSSSSPFSVSVSLDDIPALGKGAIGLLNSGSARIRVKGDAQVRFSLLPIIEIPYYIPTPFDEIVQVGGD